MALNDPTDEDKKKNTKECKKLCKLTEEDIERLLEDRLSFTGRGNDIYSRYSAYDYCYNYFRDIHEDFLKREEHKLDSDEMEKLCLQLGLFLGTWGMFRNSDLQKCSYKIYEPLIETIFKEEKLWNIDVKHYCIKKGEINPDTCQAIRSFKKEISVSLGKNCVSVTDTQATKIMMVVFGCVPAYDSYFTETLENKTFNEESLKEIYEFYDEHKDRLEKKQKELKTVDVKCGLTDYTYTMAKIIDIIGFQEKEKTDIKNMKVTPAVYKTGKNKGKPKGEGITEWDDRENRKQNRIKRIKKLLAERNIEPKGC